VPKEHPPGYKPSLSYFYLLSFLKSTWSAD